MTTIIDGTQKGVKLTYGDYVHFGGDEVYHIRGNGNCPQLYLDAEKTAEREGQNELQAQLIALHDSYSQTVQIHDDKHQADFDYCIPFEVEALRKDLIDWMCEIEAILYP